MAPFEEDTEATALADEAVLPGATPALQVEQAGESEQTTDLLRQELQALRKHFDVIDQLLERLEPTAEGRVKTAEEMGDLGIRCVRG